MRRVIAVRYGCRLRQCGQGIRRRRSVSDFDVGYVGNRSDGRFCRLVAVIAIAGAVIAAIPAAIAGAVAVIPAAIAVGVVVGVVVGVAARRGFRRFRKRIVDFDDNAFCRV